MKLTTPGYKPASCLPVTGNILRPVTTGLIRRKGRGVQRISMYLKVKLAGFKFYVPSYVNQFVPHFILCLTKIKKLGYYEPKYYFELVK